MDGASEEGASDDASDDSAEEANGGAGHIHWQPEMGTDISFIPTDDYPLVARTPQPSTPILSTTKPLNVLHLIPYTLNVSRTLHLKRYTLNPETKTRDQALISSDFLSDVISCHGERSYPIPYP